MSKVMPVRLGLVLSIVAGVSALCLALVADDAKQLKAEGEMAHPTWFQKYRAGLSKRGGGFPMLQSFLPGCNNNDPLGIFLCVLLASIDGFVAGAVIGVLYNEIPVKV